jgi:hypothetical protein
VRGVLYKLYCDSFSDGRPFAQPEYACATPAGPCRVPDSTGRYLGYADTARLYSTGHGADTAGLYTAGLYTAWQCAGTAGLYATRQRADTARLYATRECPARVHSAGQ